MYRNMKTDYITQYNSKNITKEFLIELLKYTAVNCPFSTFGYIKDKNSQECLESSSSGNCVALSLYLKNILENYGIKSVLIPAGVPNMYAHEDYLDIAHVALCIPYREFAYVLDPAFYFLEPMIVMFSDIESIKTIDSYSIYSNEKKIIQYKLQAMFENKYLNEYQTLPKEIYYIEANFIDALEDKWNYYLVEINNPDESISSFYMSIKRYPFITALNDDYSIKHSVRFHDKDHLVIKHNYKTVFEGNPKDVPLNILKMIQPYHLELKLPKNIQNKCFFF